METGRVTKWHLKIPRYNFTIFLLIHEVVHQAFFARFRKTQGEKKSSSEKTPSVFSKIQERNSVLLLKAAKKKNQFSGKRQPVLWQNFNFGRNFVKNSRIFNQKSIISPTKNRNSTKLSEKLNENGLNFKTQAVVPEFQNPSPPGKTAQK